MDLNSLLKLASEIAKDVTAKEIETADRDGIWVKDTMEALKSCKLTGLVVPEAFGGLGQGLHAVAKISEELGKDTRRQAYVSECTA